MYHASEAKPYAESRQRCICYLERFQNGLFLARKTVSRHRLIELRFYDRPNTGHFEIDRKQSFQPTTLYYRLSRQRNVLVGVGRQWVGSVRRRVARVCRRASSARRREPSADDDGAVTAVAAAEAMSRRQPRPRLTVVATVLLFRTASAGDVDYVQYAPVRLKHEHKLTLRRRNKCLRQQRTVTIVDIDTVTS